MAFGQDENSLRLETGTLFLGAFTNPGTIGTDNVFPSSKFSGDKIGFIVQGTQVFNLPDTFVEALTETPQKLIRKDPIRRQYTIEGELFDFNADILEVIYSLRVQASYSITVPHTKTIHLAHIGTSSPPRLKFGLLLQAQDVAGKDQEIAMYNGISTPENLSFTFSGTDYVKTAFKFEGTPHPDFTTSLENRSNLGYAIIDVT